MSRRSRGLSRISNIRLLRGTGTVVRITGQELNPRPCGNRLKLRSVELELESTLV